MKGQPVPLLLPQEGQQRSVIPHLAGRESVVDGLNMTMTLDGRYGCRPGYEQYGNTGLTERPVGSAFFRDVNRTPQIVVAGATSWFIYSSGSDAWVSITPAGDPLTGTEEVPVRFTTFFQSNQVWVLGCNDVAADRIKWWNPTLAEYTEIAAAPGARDITVLANRVVAVNTTEAGIRHADRVRWSAEADATTWPALGFADLDGAGEDIIGIERLTRTTAAIYRANSIWVLQAQAGGDATAFGVEQVSRGNHGPISPSVVVPVGRSHYFIGRDSKVYRFDGIEPTVVSAPIAKLLDDLIDPTYWDTGHGIYDSRSREIWWWVTAKGDTTPKIAFVYDLDGERWEVLQRFSVGITTSTYGEGPGGGTWDSDNATWDSDQSSWDAVEGSPEILLFLGTDTNLMTTFGQAVSDAGGAIEFSWTLPVTYAGERSKLLPDEVENFFVPAAAGSGPTLTVSVYGFQHPLADRELLYSGSIDVTSSGRHINSSGDTSFDTTNYRPGLQVEFTGSTLNCNWIQWGGGTMQVYEETDG